MRFLTDESGASAAEYALLLALVGIIIVGGMTILGSNINSVFGYAANTIGTPK